MKQTMITLEWRFIDGDSHYIDFKPTQKKQAIAKCNEIYKKYGERLEICTCYNYVDYGDGEGEQRGDWYYDLL